MKTKFKTIRPPTKKKKSEAEMYLLRVWVPAALKDAFKAKCARRNKLITHVITDMMQGYVEFPE